MLGVTRTVLLTTVIAMVAACGDPASAPTGLPNTTNALPGERPSTRTLDASVASASARGLRGFGFNGTLSGFGNAVVFLTGGGSFDAATANNVVPTNTRAVSGGGFRCIVGVEQGLLNGCASGEGVRWDTAQLLESTPFKCSAADPVKTAFTGDNRVVLLADFYLAGHGNNESFTAPMIVSETDLAPLIDGEQNVWIMGVGCGTAVVHFSK